MRRHIPITRSYGLKGVHRTMELLKGTETIEARIIPSEQKHDMNETNHSVYIQFISSPSRTKQMKEKKNKKKEGKIRKKQSSIQTNTPFKNQISNRIHLPLLRHYPLRK